MTIIKLC